MVWRREGRVWKYLDDKFIRQRFYRDNIKYKLYDLLTDKIYTMAKNRELYEDAIMTLYYLQKDDPNC